MRSSRREKFSQEKHGEERTRGVFRRKGKMSSAKTEAQKLDCSPLHFIRLLHCSLVLWLNAPGRQLFICSTSQLANK